MYIFKSESRTVDCVKSDSTGAFCYKLCIKTVGPMKCSTIDLRFIPSLSWYGISKPVLNTSACWTYAGNLINLYSDSKAPEIRVSMMHDILFILRHPSEKKCLFPKTLIWLNPFLYHVSLCVFLKNSKICEPNYK